MEHNYTKKKITLPLIILIILSILAISVGIVVTLSVQGIIPLSVDNPPKLQDLVWRIANFFILITILHVILTDRLLGFIRNRKSAIKNALDDAKRDKEEAEKRYNEVMVILSREKEEMNEIRKSFIEEGEKERELLIKNAEREAEKIRFQVKTTANQELLKARFTLRAEAVDLAVKMAEELLKKNIKDDDQKRIVRDYINKTSELT